MRLFFLIYVNKIEFYNKVYVRRHAVNDRASPSCMWPVLHDGLAVVTGGLHGVGFSMFVFFFHQLSV